MRNYLREIYAFTLAEVLITLAVIGVVAAVTMPVLITNINERVNSERHANIAYKITQAMEQMRAHGKLVQFESTDAFVDELQKYLKIQKRCSASNIAECWPTETVTTNEGDEINIADIKTRKNLLSGSDTDGNNVGLILADGTSLILTYDPTEQGKDIGDRIAYNNDKQLPVGNGKFRSFAYTTGVTSGLDFITDVNGKRGPNSEKTGSKWNDIRAFRGAQMSKGCAIGVKIDGIGCVVDLGNTYGTVGTSSCDYGVDGDAYRGALKACRDAGMELIDDSSLQKLDAVIDNYTSYIPYSAVWVYSGAESEEPGNTATFGYVRSNYYTAWNWRCRHDFHAVCVKK